MNIIIPKYDRSIDGFIVRAGLTEKQHIYAIDFLMRGLKWADLASRAAGIYPLVGGTQATHTQNLISSSYSLSWAGTVTHNWEGAQGNKTTGQAIAMQNQFLGARPSLAAYIRRQNSSGTQFYMGSSYGTNTLSLGRGETGTKDSFTSGETSSLVGAAITQAASIGMFSGSRINTNDARLFKNGAQIASTSTAASFTPDTRNSYLLCNYNANRTDAVISFAFYGFDMDNKDNDNLYRIVQGFQQILGRAV